MLSFQTVHPHTLELLKRIAALPELQSTRLVGGTALALQYGHRQSIDLDFFGAIPQDKDEIITKYPEYSEYRALLSMTYFEDAEMQNMPHMFIDASWENIKQTIIAEVKKYQL